MPETKSHQRAKRRAAGTGGRTEKPLPGGQRLDAITSGGHRATEVERSGDPARLHEAVQRLNKSGAPQRVLQVPQKDLEKAAEIARAESNKSMTVKNMGGTQRQRVRKKR